MRGWPTRLESSLPRVLAPSHWCVCECASLLSQGGDELAAEVGDVGDHAAPDRVESGRETTGYVSNDRLGGLEWPQAFGWCGCWYGTPDGDWKWGRLTAFEWVHARWDNAGGELLRPPRPR